ITSRGVESGLTNADLHRQPRPVAAGYAAVGPDITAAVAGVGHEKPAITGIGPDVETERVSDTGDTEGTRRISVRVEEGIAAEWIGVLDVRSIRGLANFTIEAEFIEAHQPQRVFGQVG